MRWVLAVTACFVLVGEAQAVTHYNVPLNTTARLGQVALLTFDLTSRGWQVREAMCATGEGLTPE